MNKFGSFLLILRHGFLINFILDNKNNLVDKNIKIEQHEGMINNVIIPEIKKFENNSIDKFIYSILNINPKKIDDKILLCNIILSFYKNIFNKMNYHEFKKRFLLKIYRNVFLFLLFFYLVHFNKKIQ